ncbi:hypothetical protein FNF27_03228 [Cafeteria roenbergensis]|uniref:Uncharacterized protein n=1 Tax=Cafeteria roenbergensis TaxID=33653 RepID=A0A5A8EH25_CAFRO|nr:hypothetical protein FNF27_03228 [Cafeteria roenbergensis]
MAAAASAARGAQGAPSSPAVPVGSPAAPTGSADATSAAEALAEYLRVMESTVEVLEGIDSKSSLTVTQMLSQSERTTKLANQVASMVRAMGQIHPDALAAQASAAAAAKSAVGAAADPAATGLVDSAYSVEARKHLAEVTSRTQRLIKSLEMRAKAAAESATTRDVDKLMTAVMALTEEASELRARMAEAAAAKDSEAQAGQEIKELKDALARHSEAYDEMRRSLAARHQQIQRGMDRAATERSKAVLLAQSAMQSLKRQAQGSAAGPADLGDVAPDSAEPRSTGPPPADPSELLLRATPLSRLRLAAYVALCTDLSELRREAALAASSRSVEQQHSAAKAAAAYVRRGPPIAELAAAAVLGCNDGGDFASRRQDTKNKARVSGCALKKLVDISQLPVARLGMLSNVCSDRAASVAATFAPDWSPGHGGPLGGGRDVLSTEDADDDPQPAGAVAAGAAPLFAIARSSGFARATLRWANALLTAKPARLGDADAAHDDPAAAAADSLGPEPTAEELIDAVEAAELAKARADVALRRLRAMVQEQREVAAAKLEKKKAELRKLHKASRADISSHFQEDAELWDEMLATGIRRLEAESERSLQALADQLAAAEEDAAAAAARLARIQERASAALGTGDGNGVPTRLTFDMFNALLTAAGAEWVSQGSDDLRAQFPVTALQELRWKEDPSIEGAAPAANASTPSRRAQADAFATACRAHERTICARILSRFANREVLLRMIEWDGAEGAYAEQGDAVFAALVSLAPGVVKVPVKDDGGCSEAVMPAVSFNGLFEKHPMLTASLWWGLELQSLVRGSQPDGGDPAMISLQAFRSAFPHDRKIQHVRILAYVRDSLVPKADRDEEAAAAVAERQEMVQAQHSALLRDPDSRELTERLQQWEAMAIDGPPMDALPAIKDEKDEKARAACAVFPGDDSCAPS